MRRSTAMLNDGGGRAALPMYQNRRVYDSGGWRMLGVVGAGELAGDLGEEEVDGIGPEPWKDQVSWRRM